MAEAKLEAREETISAAVSATEKRSVAKAAKARGHRSESAYIRSLVLRDVDRALKTP